MDRSDKIVPFRAACDLLDPLLASRKPVALKPKSYRDSPRGMGSSGINPLEVGGQITDQHVPIVKWLRLDGGVAGHPIFDKVSFQGGLDVLLWCPRGMVAEGSVGMVVGRHAKSFAVGGVFGVVA